jgi:hypothetical protein
MSQADKFRRCKEKLIFCGTLLANCLEDQRPDTDSFAFGFFEARSLLIYFVDWQLPEGSGWSVGRELLCDRD